MNIEFAGQSWSCRTILHPRQYKVGDIIIWHGEFLRVNTVQVAPNINNVNYNFTMLIAEDATGGEFTIREFDGMVWRPIKRIRG